MYASDLFTLLPPTVYFTELAHQNIYPEVSEATIRKTSRNVRYGENIYSLLDILACSGVSSDNDTTVRQRIYTLEQDLISTLFSAYDLDLLSNLHFFQRNAASPGLNLCAGTMTPLLARTQEQVDCQVTCTMWQMTNLFLGDIISVYYYCLSPSYISTYLLSIIYCTLLEFKAQSAE